MSYEMRNAVFIRKLQQKRPDFKWKSNVSVLAHAWEEWDKPQDNWSSGIDSHCVCPKLKTG